MRVSKILAVTLLFVVVAFATPVRAQSDFKMFASGGIGKSGTAFGGIGQVGVQIKLPKNFSLEPYFGLSYSWYHKPTNGGKAWGHDETRNLGFSLSWKQMHGIRPFFWFENGWRGGDTNFSDPFGDAFHDRSTGYHATPGVGIAHDFKRGFTLSGQVGKEISPDPTTRALWDIRAFGAVKYQFGLGGLKKFKP